MGNPLKGIFSKEEPKFIGTVTFESEAAKTAFLNAIYDANEGEKAMEISGVKDIKSFVEVGKKRYLIDEGEIAVVSIGPHIEHFPFEVNTDYGGYTFELGRIRKETELVVQNSKSEVVYIRMSIPYGQNHPMSFTFKTNPKHADKMETIVLSYNALRHLILRLFQDNITSDIKKVLDSLLQLEAYWKRIVEIEKLLNVSFSPANISDSSTDQGNAEKLYLLLVKQRSIRESLEDVTTTHSGEDIQMKLTLGTHIGFATRSAVLFSVYGEEVTVYVINVFFNAIVNSIDKSEEDNSYRVRYCGTAAEPLYKVVRGYVTEEEMPTIDDFGRAYKELSGAKTFNEIMDEVQGEYHSMVRMME